MGWTAKSCDPWRRLESWSAPLARVTSTWQTAWSPWAGAKEDHLRGRCQGGRLRSRPRSNSPSFDTLMIVWCCQKLMSIDVFGGCSDSWLLTRPVGLSLSPFAQVANISVLVHKSGFLAPWILNFDLWPLTKKVFYVQSICVTFQGDIFYSFIKVMHRNIVVLSLTT